MSAHSLRPRVALAAALLFAALAAPPSSFAALAAPAASFAAMPDTGSAPPESPIQLRVVPPFPCAGDTVRLEAYNPCYPCFEITFFGYNASNRIELDFNQKTRAMCQATPCGPQTRGFLLGRFAAGHYEVLVDVVFAPPADSVGVPSPIRYQQKVTFDVGTCGGEALPFVEKVFIGSIPQCDSCPPIVCPNVPVGVGLQGALPNHCWSILGFEVLPLASPIDRPVARLTLRPACADSSQCPAIPDPFSVGTSLPPQAPGFHEVEIQVAVKSCTDSAAMRIYSHVYPYVVRDSCVEPPPIACVYPYLEPANRVHPDTIPSNDPCDLRLAPGGRGSFVFASRSQNAPLAGLQGDIGASAFLHIVNLEAVGPAAGMRLDWTRKENGASFVLYSGGHLVIPAEQWAGVLRVTVQADSGEAPGIPGYVSGIVRAASDSGGNSVPICPIKTLVLPAARICVLEPTSCDANGDGVSNVADLVRMVLCLRDSASCPDPIAARPDCNGDGAFHVDDIFCCAHTILGGPPPGPGRPPGNLSISFGAPSMSGRMMSVPLRVRGASDVAGALLRINYPSDRWIAVDPAVVGGAPARAAGPAAALGANDWTPLLEVGDSDVMVGVLRLDATAPSDLTVNLLFTLRPGADPGGELTVGSSDVTASDGTPINIDLANLRQTLDTGPGGMPTSIALSPARPNPSSGSTSFVVSLPVAGNVDLGVFDLAGRRVATLFRGTLAAGERTYTWQPTDAPSGVYFARLSVDGVVRSSRVTLKVSR